VESGCYVNYHDEVTASREALIEKLTVSLHLNVPERRLLGSDSVSVEEVAAVVKRLFEQNGVFPPIARLWKPGEVVFEGFFLVKRPDGRIQMAWQRSNPVRPTELTDRSSSEYDDLDEAVLRFIESAWSKGIDGIRLTHRSKL
jgi:hypothetical protein